MKKLAVSSIVIVLVGCADREDARAKAIRERDQAIADYYSGREFVGRDGKSEAVADLARSAPKLYLYGKTRVDIGFRTTILKERFGVSVDPLAGCIVSEPLIKFAESYNAEIRKFIASKYGPTALEDAEKEAVARWQASRPKG